MKGKVGWDELSNVRLLKMLCDILKENTEVISEGGILRDILIREEKTSKRGPEIGNDSDILSEKSMG